MRPWFKSIDSKKIAIMTAILLSLFFVFYFFGLKSFIKRPQTPQIPKVTPLPATEFKAVSGGITGFPKEITIEKEAQIISNYDAETDDLYQSTRTFKSKNSANDIFIFYKNLLLKNNWQITGEFGDKEELKSLHAVKDMVNINIVITKSDKTIVEINYTRLKTNE